MTAGVDGRVAVVGGSSAGIGFAIAERLARGGARVVLTGRDAGRVDAAVGRIRAGGPAEVRGLAVDLTGPDGPERAVGAAAAAFGLPDIVVANAGGPPAMPAVDATADDLVEATRLLLLPVQRLLAASLPAMRSAGWGRVVAITSIAVREPQPGLVLSNALRAAVTGYLRTVADEVAADGVTVNTVLPGYAATERLSGLARAAADRAGTTPEDIRAGWISRIPLGRLVDPSEIAAAVAFLCSGEASGVTGVALPVDGGFGRGLV